MGERKIADMHIFLNSAMILFYMVSKDYFGVTITCFC